MGGKRFDRKNTDEWYFENFGETKECVSCEIEKPTYLFQPEIRKNKTYKLKSLCRECDYIRKTTLSEYKTEPEWSVDLLQKMGYDTDTKEKTIHQQFVVRTFLKYGIWVGD